MKKQATYHKEKRMVTCQRLLDTNFSQKYIEIINQPVYNSSILVEGYHDNIGYDKRVV